MKVFGFWLSVALVGVACYLALGSNEPYLAHSLAVFISAWLLLFFVFQFKAAKLFSHGDWLDKFSVLMCLIAIFTAYKYFSGGFQWHLPTFFMGLLGSFLVFFGMTRPALRVGAP